MAPVTGKDSSQRLLLREGLIDSIPSTLCGNNQGKNVILVIGDGMGWEMVRAGAVGKRIVDELTEMGCDIAAGCPDMQAAKDAFAGRTLEDYYTEGMLLLHESLLTNLVYRWWIWTFLPGLDPL